MITYKEPSHTRAGKIVFIALFCGFLSIQQANAATYYVSPTGADTNNGTSLSTPLKTIRGGLNKARTSGDIVYVLTGTYSETLSITQSGITLSAYPNNTPVLDGGTNLPNTNWGALIRIIGNNNTISGFEVRNCNINGTYVGGYGVQVSGHHNTVSKMNVHHIWEVGILINGDYNIVEDSKIWQSARRNLNGAGGGWSTGISSARNDNKAALIPGISSYATIRRNTVYNNWGEGLSCYEADHCTLEDNVVYDNWAQNIYISDSTNSLVQRNLAYISSAPAISFKHTAGITLADELSNKPRSKGTTVINNFLFNADLYAFSWTLVANSGLQDVVIANNTIVGRNLLVGSNQSPTKLHFNTQIRNNIVTGHNSYVQTTNGITFSNNNWAVTPSLGRSSTDTAGDPLLSLQGPTTPGALSPNYFKLNSSSPVINKAQALSLVNVDYFKTARGTAPDIGAHEFVGVITTPTPPPIATMTNIAPSAQLITASSQNTWSGLQANNAVDGVIAGYPTDPTAEWVTLQQGAGAWLQLGWSRSYKVSAIALYDRPNLNDQITSASLQFSDGSTVAVGMLDNSGAEVLVSFSAKDTSSLRLTVNTVSGKTVNVGLAEIKVFAQ